MAAKRQKAQPSTNPSCPHLPKPKNAEDAVDLLKEGNERFVDMKGQLRCNDERRDEFHYGQTPWAIILTCADSRLSPELIFDTGIGELFVVRVAGNIGNACSIASAEYAVAPKSAGGLGVELVVVLGHEDCGAVKASLNQKAISYNLNQLLGHLMPVADKYSGKWQDASTDEEKNKVALNAAKANSRNVAKQLRCQSEVMQSSRMLRIVPAMYHTGTGKVKFDAERYWQ